MPLPVVLSIEDRLRIDTICDAYESRLRGGERPSLDEFLGEHPEPFRGHLAQALRDIESEYVSSSDRPTLAFVTNPDPHEELPRVPGFEILAKLGEGGMGVVYKAREANPPRVVALKMMRTNLLPNAQARRRFHFEAEAIAALDHPGILPILSVGESQGYLCLKYLENGSLADRLKQRTRTPEEAAGLVAQVARAIQHAHDRGVLHRDLKPANILLDSEDRPCVADFGLARRILADDNPTPTESVLGTFVYMAPEQASDPRAVTVRADVYALGGILYELLTGRPPNPGMTVTTQLAWLLQDQPVVPPHTLKPGVPGDLEYICLKCLERDPERRYASAAALADDLQRFLNGEPIVIQVVGVVDWIVQLYRTKTGQAEGSYIRSTIAYGILRMALHLAIAGVVAWGTQLWSVLILLGLDFLTQGVILGAMLQRQFRQTRLADRYSIVIGSGSLLAQVLLILVCVPLNPLGSSREILALYPPLLIVAGLCGFILGATSWGVLFPLGLLTMVFSLVVPWYPMSGPFFFACLTGGSMVYWGLAKARESRPRSPTA